MKKALGFFHCKLVSLFSCLPPPFQTQSPLLLSGAIWLLTLNLSGRDRINFTFMERPINVAMLQWGMVGVNSTATVLSASFTCWKPNTLHVPNSPALPRTTWRRFLWNAAWSCTWPLTVVFFRWHFKTLRLAAADRCNKPLLMSVGGQRQPCPAAQRAFTERPSRRRPRQPRATGSS